MAGFIIETPNQCWHVIAAGKICFIAGYDCRKASPPHVFADYQEAEPVLKALQQSDHRAEKLRIVAAFL